MSCWLLCLCSIKTIKLSLGKIGDSSSKNSMFTCHHDIILEVTFAVNYFSSVHHMNLWSKLIIYLHVMRTVFMVHGKQVCCALKLVARYSKSILMYNENITTSLLCSNQACSAHFYCFYCAIDMRLNSQ